MSNETTTQPPQRTAAESELDRQNPEDSETVYCDRCSDPMFRMRAVYWCANCGYKTDCCGH
ncbi:MAG TPA: hypothetical protein VLR94_00305 [Acidobacteriota bacterium]|nr:hypothetical protein [Acidobacteriota bacterium]